MKSILKKAGIRGVKSYEELYGTKDNVFAKVRNGYPDSAWYCEIKPNGHIVINTKYYGIPESVDKYNNQLEKNPS